MQHSQKTGGHPSTFRRLGVPTREPLSFQTFTDSLTGPAKRISFFQSLAHSFRCDGGVCPGVSPQPSSASTCQRQTYPQSLPHYFVNLPIRPIAAKRPWCHNWQSRANSSGSGETTPLSPVSKTTRADIGNCSTPLPVTDSGQIGVASRA